MGLNWYKINQVQKMRRVKFVDALEPNKEYEVKRMTTLNQETLGLKLGGYYGGLLKVQGMYVIGYTPDNKPTLGIRITHTTTTPLLEGAPDGGGNPTYAPSVHIGVNMGFDTTDSPELKTRVKYYMRPSSWATLTGTPEKPIGAVGPVYEWNPAIEYEPKNYHTDNTYYRSHREYGNTVDTGSMMVLDVMNPIWPMQVGIRENPRAIISIPPAPVTIVSGCGAKPLMPPIIGPFGNYQTPSILGDTFKLICLIDNANPNNDEMFLTVGFTDYTHIQAPGGGTYNFSITPDEVTATIEPQIPS